MDSRGYFSLTSKYAEKVTSACRVHLDWPKLLKMEMTTSSLVSEPEWCTSKGDGEGGREGGKIQRGEKGMDACNKNPLLFISVAAGICNLLIGWTTLSNLLRCIKITIKNNKKQPRCRHQKNCGLLAQALEDQNLCR